VRSGPRVGQAERRGSHRQQLADVDGVVSLVAPQALNDDPRVAREARMMGLEPTTSGVTGPSTAHLRRAITAEK